MYIIPSDHPPLTTFFLHTSLPPRLNPHRWFSSMYFLSLSVSLLPLALPLATAFNSYRSLLTDCLNGAHVPILLSSSTGWAQEISAYNLRLTPAPSVVAMPNNVADVCLRLAPTGRQIANE